MVRGTVQAVLDRTGNKELKAKLKDSDKAIAKERERTDEMRRKLATLQKALIRREETINAVRSERLRNAGVHASAYPAVRALMTEASEMRHSLANEWMGDFRFGFMKREGREGEVLDTFIWNAKRDGGAQPLRRAERQREALRRCDSQTRQTRRPRHACRRRCGAPHQAG